MLEFLGVDSDFPLDCTVHSNPWTMPRFRFVNDFLYQWPTSKLFPGDFKIKIMRLNKVDARKPVMAPETREHLKGLFGDDICALEELLGRSLES